MNVTMSHRKMLVLALLLLISSFFLAQKSKPLPEPKIRALLTANPLVEYPDLALAEDGTLAIVYQQMDEPQEIIVLSMYRDGVWVDSLVLDRADIVYRPRLTVSPEGTLWVSWARKNQNAIEVVVLPVNEGRPGQMEVVSTGSARNWWQAMACDAKGRLWLAWERMIADTAQIMFSVRESGRWSRPQAVFSAPHRQMRPALAVGANGEIWCAWDGYLGDYNYDIFLRRLDQASQTWNLTNSATLEQCPALSVDAKNRLWLAWHSNADASGKPDIPRWLELRHWDGKKLFAPTAAMPDKDLAAQTEMQSWEFPTLATTREGAIWLFGRPSQEFSVQVFLGDQWSGRGNFALPGWGGRGDFVRALAAADGMIWTIRRDVGALELCGFEALPQKPVAPKLQPATERTIPAVPALAAPREKWKPETAALNFMNAPPNETLAFGDLHQHSNLSDGMGTADDCYTRSRDFYQWDFAALTDHEWFVRNRLLPSEWEYLKTITASFNAPEDFITLPAYEWTAARWPNGAGHKNVYFRDESYAIFSLADSNANSTAKLFARLKAEGAIAFPHHIGWTGVDWQNHDPVAQPNVEIVSVHGAFEYMGNEPITHRGGTPGMFMQNGLAQGLRFGVLGASDGHGLIWHHGIGRKRDPWVQGLAGVWLKGKLTRASLFEALQARRVYATSGVRILLNFSADNHAMGSEYTTNTPPKLSARVAGTGKIRYVYLLRDNQIIHQHGGDFGVGDMVRFELIDEQAGPGTHWYYVRVVQEDGEMAWSSPIWVTME